MERKQALLGGGVIVLLVGLVIIYFSYGPGIIPAIENSEVPPLHELEEEITLEGLEYNTHVTSPFTFSGVANNDWFDENGEFEVTIQDVEGNLIGSTKAKASGAVAGPRTPFTATLTFTEPNGTTGLISLYRFTTFGDGQSFTQGVAVSFVPVAQPFIGETPE